jgi:hypothetical protein
MRFIDQGNERLLTDFDFIKLGGNDHLPSQPELWKQCTTEKQYFKILAERQKKGGDYDPLILPETDEQKMIPGYLGQ